MNVNIICHKHELIITIVIIIIIVIKLGKGNLEKEGERQVGRVLKRIELCYEHVPTPEDECKLHKLQTCSNKTTNKTKKNSGITNCAAINICKHVLLQHNVFTSLGKILRKGKSESNTISGFSYLRNFHIDFCSACTSLWEWKCVTLF